jgi:hypothetical protein
VVACVGLSTKAPNLLPGQVATQQAPKGSPIAGSTSLLINPNSLAECNQTVTDVGGQELRCPGSAKITCAVTNKAV